MSVLIKNQGHHVEYVEVVNAVTGERDHATVQSNGKVTLPKGWRVLETGIELSHLHVTGNNDPVSHLLIKE